MVVSVRDRILAATLDIVGRDGVAAVSNRRIAAEAGVALGSVTYHFATQTDLLRAALLGFVDAETSRLVELAERYRDADLDLAGAAAMTEQIALDLSGTTYQLASFEMYIHAGRDPELRSAAAECFAAYDRLAVTILNGLGAADPHRLAPTMVATVTGIQLRRLATGAVPVDITDAVVALLQSATRDGSVDHPI
ncbi:TetR/AcrR family transcriptional regulator [Rhodococcoides trifolii]|uniref:TetR/AcrR family transcriptional regulator n=1 Tax=Rhodococcoides trifolii TaxID=908250 RepID=UPI00166321BE|nr:TetR/AcrR family transcriptional regulator [Rhodococcus trifolii]